MSLLEMFALSLVPCDKLDCKSASQGELLLSELLYIHTISQGCIYKQQVLMYMLFYEHSHHKLCVVS